MKRTDIETGRRMLSSVSPLVVCCLSLLLSFACASKKPVLYQQDGRPLTIVEYEKVAQKERDIARYENAIEAYKAIIDNYNDNATALVWANYETGFCYFRLEKYADAEIYFRKVINEFQDPAAKKLAQDMLTRIVEKTSKKKKR